MPQLLARRTGRAATWRDDFPLEERASAIEVAIEDPHRKELGTSRANREKFETENRSISEIGHPYADPS